MKLKDNKKLVVILIFLVILLVLGGTFAAWTWISNNSERTMVSVTLPGATLTIEGDNVTHTGMYPTAYCDGEAALIGEVATATGVNATNVDVMAVIKIRATLTVSHSSLTTAAKEKINWAIVDTSAGTTCETTQYKGTMSSVTTNTDIDTGISFVVPAGETVTKSYRIYVWLDSTYEYRNHGSNITNPMDELDIKVEFSSNSELIQLSDSSTEPEAPVLDDGMIPVKIANNGVVTTVSNTDPTWYNYDNKEWANVVLVKNSGIQTRSYYKSNTGVTVDEDDILAYYVWIPRYKYRIPSEVKCSVLENPTIEDYPECYSYIISDTDKELFIEYWYNNENDYLQDEFGLSYTMEEASEDVETMLNTGSVYIEQEDEKCIFTDLLDVYNDENDPDITYTRSFNGNNTSEPDENLPRTIDVVFESKYELKSIGDAINTYYTHPAFIWDGNNVSGIWVGKFEATGDATTPTILPNSSSLRSQNISTQFITSLKFAGGVLSNGIVTFTGNNTYGLISSTDSHMMKNSEWGAVAYLSHSKYGINYEIRINNNVNFITGCGALEENGAALRECQIAYGENTSYPQSTTGNITGIFDMSGGSFEYVMGVYSDDDGNPMSGQTSSDNSGFNGTLSDNSIYTQGIPFPESKYYDLYLQSQFTGNYNSNIQFCTLETCGGHALYETANWYDDGTSFVYYEYPWFDRGEAFEATDVVGMFNAGRSRGQSDGYSTWRSVIVVD